MRAVVGLGSNLGDRIANLREATARVARVCDVLARSRVYETAPVGGPPQGDFLNAALLVECSKTHITPAELLAALLAVEAEMGRTREVRWGPRTIDLDLLWIEGEVVDEPRLVVPHPRLLERAFALLPLLDVVPDARDPRTGAPYRAPANASVRTTESPL